MVQMTSSQRKMLAKIQKSKEKGIRWDRLYQKYGDVASYQELMALTQQGLLKIVSANGTEMDVPDRIPNPPKASELYAVCTWAARDIVKRERSLDLRDYISIGIGVIGLVLSIANFVLSARTGQQTPKAKDQTVSQISCTPTE